MKLLKLKFKIIIGVVLFIVLICAGYCAKNTSTSKTTTAYDSSEYGEAVYNGKFLTPVENFIKVTSKYGTRVHPISRSIKKTYRY